MNGLVKFSPEYMVGTYADRYDVTSEEAIEIARKRAKEYFDDEVKKSISGSDIVMLKNNPYCKVKDVEYALFPVVRQDKGAYPNGCEARLYKV